MKAPKYGNLRQGSKREAPIERKTRRRSTETEGKCCTEITIHGFIDKGRNFLLAYAPHKRTRPSDATTLPSLDKRQDASEQDARRLE